MEIAGEHEKQTEGFGELAMVMATSIALIYIALVLQFRNTVKPLLVFAAIPYGLMGALLALWAMGEAFGFMAFLGSCSMPASCASGPCSSRSGPRCSLCSRWRCTAGPCGSRCATPRSAG